MLADTHPLQRSEVFREPEEEEFTPLGLCGKLSLVTIKYLLTRRPQMSGSAGSAPLRLRVGCPLICSAYMPLAQTRVARWETDVLHTPTLTSLVCSLLQIGRAS